MQQENIEIAATSKKRRIIKNLLILCIGFLLQFCAYQGLANLQSTMNSEDGIGVSSQCVIYAALILSSLFLPKVIIGKIGCKWTLVVSMLTYAPYIAANFLPHTLTFMPSAFLVGLGAAPLWSAKCVYLNEISRRYAVFTKERHHVVISRFFGIFFMIFGTTQIWGNLTSYYVLKPTNNDTSSLLSNNITITCGVNFCSHVESENPNLNPPNEHERFTLTGIYLSLIVSAALTVAFGLDSLEEAKTRNENNANRSRLSWLRDAGATLKHMKNLDQILLIPLTIYSGIEQAFFLSEFTTAYIACSWGIYHVGYIFICYGIVDASMAYLTGRLMKCLPRPVIFCAGAVGNLAASVGMFIWTPNSEEYPVFFIFAAVWGFSDAIWQTHINAFYGSLFLGEEEAAAFSNYRLWESMGFFIAFAISNYLCVKAKLSTLISFLIVGMCGYSLVELRIKLKKTTP